MTTKEHVKTAQKARTLLFEAYVEFLDGDAPLKACEKLWQSAAHAIAAVAQQRGWDYKDDPESLNDIICRLGEEQDEPYLISAFSAAKMFRDNVEYDFMEDFQYKSARPRARRFVEHILSFSEVSDGDTGD